MGNFTIKRIYEPAEKTDGTRILVDRLWPRGISKERAHIDQWLKEVAPSPQLRKQFHQNPQNWPWFEHEYIAELKQQEAVKELAHLIQNQEAVTLLYASHDEKQNHALVLQQFLNTLLKSDHAV
ncbi:DUF488 domain-containing protein [Mucilaginibacter aquaedulcis]|uniref:DUF488 domain-containing protein n=1 Tax=Mucilaginibacter aquaedulcis TaxID=1187081 RepID=UPI0025B4B241|nr:DUF488 family protein [Mucilaginibacter aquaedulcis]MDN3549586.1 DUF488 family protein [Mucilaginibacter aquaedulcis]